MDYGSYSEKNLHSNLEVMESENTIQYTNKTDMKMLNIK